MNFLNFQNQKSLLQEFEATLKENKLLRQGRNCIQLNLQNFENQQVCFEKTKKNIFKFKLMFLKDLQIEWIFDNCKLVCTVISSEPMIMASMIIVVQDAQNDIARVAIYNYHEIFEEKDLIKNTKIIILNPYYKIAIDGQPLIRIDNPYDIIIDKNNKNESKIKKKKETKKLKQKQKQITKYYSSEDYKKLGNDEFGNKNYNNAINFYSKAIQLDKNQAIYYGNRAQAYLEIKKYKRALEDTEFAIALNPNNAKFYFRKALALLGKCQYATADQFLKEKEFPQTDQQQQQIKTLHETIKRLRDHTEGKYDFLEIMQAIKQKQNDYQIEEFIGPLKHVINKTNQKIIIATRDIHQGEILLVTKAFSYSKQYDIDEIQQINFPISIEVDHPNKIKEEQFQYYINEIKNNQNGAKQVQFILNNPLINNLNLLKLSSKLNKNFPQNKLTMQEHHAFYLKHLIQCENLSDFHYEQSKSILQYFVVQTLNFK